MFKKTYILFFIFLTISCFKKPAKVNLVETLSLEEKESAWTTNIPINLQEALAGRVTLDLPNVLIKQQDGYEEFVLDIIEPEHTFDWMLFKYDLSTPEMRDIHEEQLKIKYRFSRDGSSWSEWKYDTGTEGYEFTVPEISAQRMIQEIGPTPTTLPQRYVEFIVVSYEGVAGDTLFKNPKYSTHRYWRDNNTDVGRTVKKNNKITIS